jgi:DNA-binding NarL/FixJ family response regulator
MQSHLNIILLDDHVLIREAMCGVLRELLADVVVLEAAKASEARRILKQVSEINLLILDLGLPDMCGLEFLKELRQSYPQLPVVVMSGVVDQKKVLEVINSGALGFIPKATSRQDMISAIKKVLSGDVYIPQDLFRSENKFHRF